jgi:squalene-hopene/tetraprenyl-beta-curcumene cyclase
VEPGPATVLDLNAQVDQVVEEMAGRLRGAGRDDGHWIFELEADATIPSEYVLLRHFLGEPNEALEAGIGRYLRRIQGAHGGWPLFHEGDFDISASVKAYYALKIIGDDVDAPHMRRAREAILAHGGAARANVFTRFTLALFGQVPWRAVPVMPVEIMLLPRWFPFHLSKVSYWSRTVIVPLIVLTAVKPLAANPRGVDIRDLFTVPPEEERHYNVNPTGKTIGEIFLTVDKVLRAAEPLFPRKPRQRAIDKAMRFVTERLNGIDGLGGIYPAMANLVMAYHALGYPADHPDVKIARDAVENLVTVNDDGEAYVQPCLSPVWDTALAFHAMLEAGEAPDAPALKKASAWLRGRQVLDTVGDYAERRPEARPGGWAFQYANDHYPDVDDTAAVVMALHRQGGAENEEAIARATEWILAMQSKNGGWGAFDADNTHHYLNHIPFADHGALLDPPTADVTARCLGMLAQLGYERDHPAVRRAIGFLHREQEADGSWYGRWGANYVYGTWSVLVALNAAGEDLNGPVVRRAVDWLVTRQREDGGWGEDCATYWGERRSEVKESTPSQTAWAVLALMAAGETESEAVRRGIAYLVAHPRDGVRWQESLYTGVGFPRVFYLKYHGYAAYFPLWAVARYRSLMRRNDRTVQYGI